MFEIDKLEFLFLVEILFTRVILVIRSILLECGLEPVNQVVHLGLQNLDLILLKELFDDALKIFQLFLLDVLFLSKHISLEVEQIIDVKGLR